MVTEMLLQLYAQNGVRPHEADCDFQGIVVHNKAPKLQGEEGEVFRSMICDCDPDGCCST